MPAEGIVEIILSFNFSLGFVSIRKQGICDCQHKAKGIVLPSALFAVFQAKSYRFFLLFHQCKFCVPGKSVVRHVIENSIHADLAVFCRADHWEKKRSPSEPVGLVSIP